METCKYTQAVNEDIEIAKDMNVQGVPFFVINEKYALTGAQPVDAFLGVLEKIWGEEGSVFSQTTKGTNFCRSEEHTSELQSRGHLVCRLLLEKETKQHTHNETTK